MKKPLVIAKFTEKSLSIFKDQIIYKPEFSSDNIDITKWQEVIKTYLPTTIIFDTGIFSKAMLRSWREFIPDGHLILIRKGVTLARCDLETAAKLKIAVFNTPGINPPFIANYICEFLFKDKTAKEIVVLGSGNISELVAGKMSAAGANLTIIGRNNLKITAIINAFKKADAIVICLPFKAETKELINEKAINAIPHGAKFTSISFPTILTDRAIKALHAREDIDVIFDYLKEEFDKVREIIGSDIRSNFILAEKATASDACQQALDKAAMELALKF